jgi:mRNA interferase MazF
LERALARGAVWYVDLDPIRGHEQGRPRPIVIVSANTFNAGPAALVIICPLSTRDRGIPSHVQIDPPEGGLRRRSFVQCEQVRTISIERLTSRFGELSARSMAAIDARLRILLAL